MLFAAYPLHAKVYHDAVAPLATVTVSPYLWSQDIGNALGVEVNESAFSYTYFTLYSLLLYLIAMSVVPSHLMFSI